MTALAARRMGLRITTFEPGGEHCPAAPVSDHLVSGDWLDEAAIDAFCSHCDLATLEFENVPGHTAQAIAGRLPLRPAAAALEVCQHRERERGFLARHGFPQPRHAIVASAEEFAAAAAALGRPCVLKTLAFGYDGKGQRVLREGENAQRVWREWGGGRGIVEAFIDFTCELSVVCARCAGGRMATFPVPENIHTGGILDLSIFPGRFSAEVARHAAALAGEITAALDVVGLLTVEMFLDHDHRLLVNELAPRPHNSGHASIDACLTSQFEQHARAVCGWPLGDTALLSPCVMVNLLGNLWRDGEPDWSPVLANPRAKLHLYGKRDPAPGRKMGHFCVLAESREQALAEAGELSGRLLAERSAAEPRPLT